jgi:cell division septation protein DedD
MATRRRPSARGRAQGGAVAWLGTLVVGSILIGAGFGAGVLLGVLTEEPSVLASLWGAGERVALARTASPVEPTGAAGPARPRSSKDAPAVPQRAAHTALGAASPPAQSPLPAVGTPPSGFAVQVGAFSTADAARAMEAKLEAAGYDGFVAAGAASRDRRWRVRVGPFADRNEADRAAARLEEREGLSTWIVSLDDEG